MAKQRIFAADFETTVEENTALQTSTEVWSAASVELYTEEVTIFHSISELFDYYCSMNCDIISYFHNVKFDGNFWLYYLLHHPDYHPAYNDCSDPPTLKDKKELLNNEFTYVISDKGQWYTITIKTSKGKYIEIYDSLKLLPFSLASLGKAFKTKHRKLEMEYKGNRYAGCDITKEELQYIANDVLVLKEALEVMYNQGHNKLTIGSCCLSEYKEIMGDLYDKLFPNLYEQTLSPEYGSPTIGDWILRSYRGGWCYLVKGKEKRLYHNGVTADVNSLYPSVMHSDSGNYYPVGLPKMHHIPPIDEDVFWETTMDERTNPNWFQPYAKDEFWFFRIRTRFRIKPGKLPFVQIKGTMIYNPTEMLETSDVVDEQGILRDYYITPDGLIHDTKVELTLTQTDFILLREHYDLYDYELLDYAIFKAEIGLFDNYINTYAEIKKHSTGAMRTLAKLFLNNLYGKMASTTNSSYKIAYLNDEDVLSFRDIDAHDKKPGYIAVGTCITSYARNFTIRAAQKNYYGPDEPGFIYADTDSIHCDIPPDKLIDVPVHPTNFCAWKLESSWDVAWFTRQKTYIEHIVAEDLEPIDSPYYNIKCAGMSSKPKHLFELSLEPTTAELIHNGKNPDNPTEDLTAKDFTPDDVAFLSKTRSLSDFVPGLQVPGKLRPKRIPGGVLLVDTYYTMH